MSDGCDLRTQAIRAIDVLSKDLSKATSAVRATVSDIETSYYERLTLSDRAVHDMHCTLHEYSEHADKLNVAVKHLMDITEGLEGMAWRGAELSRARSALQTELTGLKERWRTVRGLEASTSVTHRRRSFRCLDVKGLY
jgi:hypothetical protein